MIGLDTNLLVRHLTRDDPGQADMASRFLEQTCRPDSPGFVNHVVLCELVWVLETAYSYRRDQIAAAIEALLRAVDIEVEDAELAWLALRAYRDPGVDFADALIGLTNRAHGCDRTTTFDRRAARMAAFVLLEG